MYCHRTKLYHRTHTVSNALLLNNTITKLCVRPREIRNGWKRTDMWCIVNKWVKNRIERQNILLQETRLSGISREVGSLDKSGSKWGYYKGASFRSVYDILNHWSAQKEALWGWDHQTLLKQKANNHRKI